MHRRNWPWLTSTILILPALGLAGCAAPKEPAAMAAPPPAVAPGAFTMADGPASTGTATYYGIRHHGRRTASGEVFDRHAMTAAHRDLPLGSTVRITSLVTGESVVVRITDRCRCSRAMIDLSEGAARAIGMLSTSQVRMERL